MAFTAAQIPDIACRLYPPELCGDLYPKGIPIWPEEELERMGGDSPKSTYWTSYRDSSWKLSKHPRTIASYSSYEIMGYLNVAGSMSIISDSGDSVELLAGPGRYPIYGYYLNGYLLGMFIDLSDSRRPVQIYPSLSNR